jgi:hypothetical protein
MPHTDLCLPRLSHPVDMIEQIAAAHDWPFERFTDDEITLSVSGAWSDYDLSISWMAELEALHVGCSFEMKVPGPRRAEVRRLIALLNERMWLGHFDLWSGEGMVMYRHGLLLAGGAEASDPQCEALVATAVEACERHFPAFQFVVWAGKSAKDALDAVLFETAGEA